MPHCVAMDATAVGKISRKRWSMAWPRFSSSAVGLVFDMGDRFSATVRVGGTCRRAYRTRRAGPRSFCRPRLPFAQRAKRLPPLLGGVLVILQPAAEIRLVGREVEEAVAAQVEHDGLPLAFLLRLQRLADGSAHRVGRLRRGQDALGA